jgi:hypothetical protein
VDPEKPGKPPFHQVLGHQPVGEEHELLNEAPGPGLLLGDEAQGAPLHLHLHLGEAEVQRALLQALLPHPLGEVQKKAQVLG